MATVQCRALTQEEPIQHTNYQKAREKSEKMKVNLAERVSGCISKETQTINKSQEDIIEELLNSSTQFD